MATTDQRPAELRDVDTSRIDSPVELWAEYPGITSSRMFEEYVHRLHAERDLRAYITGSAETGVGKTTLAVILALLWDQWGWTADKATLDSREYSARYDEVLPGSVLVLDEAEQALDKRRAMKQEIVDVGHDFVTKRFKQVFGLLTLPTKNWLDPRVADDVCDYWIQCQETDKGRVKGEAKVYRLRNNEHYETSYTKRTETITWPAIDENLDFQELTQKKVAKVTGAWKSKYIPRSEVEEMRSNFWNKATKKTGYDLATALYEWGLSQNKVAEVFSLAGIKGFSQPQVSRLLDTEDFEDWYYDE